MVDSMKKLTVAEKEGRGIEEERLLALYKYIRCYYLFTLVTTKHNTWQ